MCGDPQDDVVYYGNAFSLFTEGPRYLERFRNLPTDFLANPIDQFHVRPMVTYPIAASFSLFGPGEMTAVLWGYLCSISSVLVVYRLACVLHGRSAGLVAALLCAFYPLEVINGTRILSDVQLGFFSSLGLLLLVEASIRGSAGLYALSGAAAAGAYLANARGLLVLLALVGCASVLAALRRAAWRAPACVLGGFLAIFSVEAFVYYWSTGDPFLSYRIQSSASLFKYLNEHVTSFRLGWLEVRYTNGAPLALLRSAFLLDGGRTNQFGLYFYFFLAAALFSISRRRNRMLVALAVGLLCYLEWGPVAVSVDWPHRDMHYMMMFKQQRFLLMLTAPLVVVAAYFLCAIARASRTGAALLMVVLFVTSLAAITRTRNFYRAGLHDLRAAAVDVSSNPDRMFFADAFAVQNLRIFTRYRAANLSVLDSAASEVRHACVMLGGSRGVELLADYVESSLPAVVREVLETGVVPRDWRLVKEIKGDRSPQRLRDFKIYCVP